MKLTRPLFEHAVAAAARVLRFDQPADSLLSAYFRSHHELGQQDRGFVAESVYGMLRRKRYLEHIAKDAAPRRLLLAYLTRVAGMSMRDLEAAAGHADAEWIAQLKAARGETLSAAVQADFPDWIADKLAARMPEADWVALGRAMQQPAPLDLRVNTLRATREVALAGLREAGVEADPTPYSPTGLRVKGKPALNRHALFLSGAIEVQDEGSQLLAYLLAPRRGELVVDFCAGAGGKSLQIGAMMHSRGRIYAFDVSEKRLSRLAPRLARSGLSNLHAQRIVTENDARVKRLAGKIDRVLVDAPCSGLGTLRRNPDLKWRQWPQSVGELAAKQLAILTAAARLLKPGGRLVYATCSILREENRDVVDAFLAAHPQFAPLDCAGLFRTQGIPLDTGPYLELAPHVHGTDGFFAAAMEKRAPHA